MTYNGSEQKLYVDGVLRDSNSYSGAISTNSNDLIIGNGINGKIDDIRIYNASLSAEQIKALYENRTDLIVSQETDRNDTWKACITPNDKYDNGDEKCSSNLTIFIEPRITSGGILADYPKFGENNSIQVEVEDDNTVYVNFTVVNPDGIIVIDNVNGTRNSPWGSPTFETNVTGTWEWNATAGDADGLTATMYGSFDVTVMNIEANIDPNPAHIGEEVHISGNINLSNGTIVADSVMHINTTTNGTRMWYRNTSSSIIHEYRFPFVIEALSGFENKPVNVFGQDLVDANPGLDLPEINISAIEVIDPLGIGAAEEENGHKLESIFHDEDSDNVFDNSDFIEFDMTMSAGEKKLMYVYDNMAKGGSGNSGKE